MPGLVAKPIIDIVLGVDDPDDEPGDLPDLQRAGYELRIRQPGHRCLRAGDPDEPVNLHCLRPEDDEVRRFLLFRDRLRADDADRALYARSKREPAQREWRDINFYADAKSPVIDEILARRLARLTGRPPPAARAVGPGVGQGKWLAPASRARSQ